MTQEQEEGKALAEQSVSRWISLAIAVGFLALTWPIWRWLWREWMANDYYSHGILIVPTALYLAWRRLRNQERGITRPDDNGILALLSVAIGLAFFLYFLNDKAYYLAAFAMVGMIAGLVWTLAGRRVLWLLAFPLAYLLLMIPLPFIERATLPLALFTGVCSTTLVKFLGLELTVIGNAVKLPNADLLIGAQCSGINSMIALMALTALAAYVLDGPLWGRISLVFLAGPIAMLGNILRVSNLLFVARYYGADAAFRFYHDYSGIVFFVLVLIMMIPLTRLLRCSSLRLEVL